MRQEIAEQEADKAESAEWIFEGLPQHITLAEAIAIKAERGDPTALKWHQETASKEFRIRQALMEAALKTHPQIVEKPKGAFEWIGEGEMPSADQMIDWFQLNHPRRAREIEDGIDEA